ncbi:MAG: hypothetical protein FWH27_11785 [Planctomycetaceae bacterium]|nr:hypothetical protein [Planctomycetaceae bacterium]
MVAVLVGGHGVAALSSIPVAIQKPLHVASPLGLLCHRRNNRFLAPPCPPVQSGS